MYKTIIINSCSFNWKNRELMKLKCSKIFVLFDMKVKIFIFVFENLGLHIVFQNILVMIQLRKIERKYIKKRKFQYREWEFDKSLARLEEKVRMVVECSVQLLQNFMSSTTRTSAITTVGGKKGICSCLFCSVYMSIFIGRIQIAFQNLVSRSLRNVISKFPAPGIQGQREMKGEIKDVYQ